MTTTSDRLTEKQQQTLRDIGGQKLIENVGRLLEEMDDEFGTIEPTEHAEKLLDEVTEADREILEAMAQ